MKKILLFLILLVSACLAIYSQDLIAEQSVVFDKTSIGVGGGMDYGGIGGSFLIYPHRNIGLFVGAGYAIAGFGYNLGSKIRLVTEKHKSPFSPYLLAMYGYNAAIAVTNATQYNKLFYGPTLGFGTDFKSRPGKKGYWSFALLLPIRNSELDTYFNDLKTNHNIEFKNELMPVGFSFGYRVVIN
jgi:hypothetical protein